MIHLKRLFVALLVISVTLLLRCSTETSNEGEATFIGKTESIDGQIAIVKIEEDEKIKVKHSGEVMEKYPLGINTISVELVGID